VHCLGFYILEKKENPSFSYDKENEDKLLKTALIMKEIMEGIQRVLIRSEYICICSISAHTEITAQFYI